MKKITSIILSIIMLISTITVLPIISYADDDYKKSGDYLYTVNSKNEVTLTEYTKKGSKKVVIPAKIDGKKVVRLGRGLFHYTNADVVETIEEVVISDGIEIIQQYAFNKMSNLKTVHIPDSVIQIGQGAFAGCENLSNLRLSKNLKYVGAGAFYNTPKLEKYDDGKGGLYFDNILIHIEKEVKEYHVKDGTTIVTCLAMDGKNDIEKLYFPKSLRYISDIAFSGCGNLNTVVFSNGIKEIGEKAFYNSPKLKSVTIPKSVTKIGEHAFGYYFYNPTNSTPTNQQIEYKPVKDFVIKGYTNSTAQKYAKKNKIKFTSNALKKPVIKVTAGKNQIKIKYTKKSDATGFEVKYKRNGRTFTKTFKTSKSATKKINKLPKGKYKVQVRTYHTSGNKKAYSPWSAVKSVTIK